MVDYLCHIMLSVKNTIPVYDIDTINKAHRLNENIIAEPFGSYLLVHPNLHSAHRHNFYHIVFFTEGSGTHTIDFEQFDVQPGQIYFMIPGQVHSWNFIGNTDGYVINFSEDFLSSFVANQQYLDQFAMLQGTARACVVNIEKQAQQYVKQIFVQIIDEVKSKGFLNHDMICAQLITLLIAVSRQGEPQEHTTAPRQNQLLLLNFRKLTDQYYATLRLPKEYAAMLYITPNHLNALCKDLLGKSAGEIIRDRVLLEAKRLLINANLSIATISNQLNFADNSYFTKFFKKYEQMTPEEFRKKSSQA